MRSEICCDWMSPHGNRLTGTQSDPWGKRAVRPGDQVKSAPLGQRGDYQHHFHHREGVADALPWSAAERKVGKRHHGLDAVCCVRVRVDEVPA